MSRTILVVDDVSINRQILHKILSKDYTVVEAANGEEAVEILLRQHQIISAVLLDLVMPVMDGYDVLEKMRHNPTFSQIPVIIISADTEGESEKRALALGATDYIKKPFDPAIIRSKLMNLIKLRETSASVNAFRRDRLTGLWNVDTFYEKAAWMIKLEPAGYYYLSCIDIDNFKVVNDQYGIKKGDEVLTTLAKILSDDCEKNGGLCGRVAEDNFVALFPTALMNTDTIDLRKNASMTYPDIEFPITLSMGRYIISDKSLSVSSMYDRASIAQETIKGRYDVHVAVYDESMRDRLVREQEIKNDMRIALATGQFETWFQPQYNHVTGALIGAEALVRWRHPVHGLIPPADFIPIFEKNGFVYELDKFVWEQVCGFLQKWIAEGRNPMPVSVNISRYDLLRPELVEVIESLIRKYDLTPELLRLEVTESVFAESTTQIVPVIKTLIAKGFTVEIDDFGSGYSSLNTLKDVPAQIVKLDMRFLENSDLLDRGGSIVESVIRMVRWLDMVIIAEGVEDIEQADFLKSIGCNYVQGYLYARPMPLSDYEALARGIGKEQKLLQLETVKNLDNNAFWDPHSLDTLIFNSYVGAACIFEYNLGHIELVRATDKYTQVIGNAGLSVEDALKLDWATHLDEDDRKMLGEALQLSRDTKDEIAREYTFWNLPGCPERTCLRSTMRVIATAGERMLIYCTNENLTAQREAERLAQDASVQMQAIMQNINGGISAATLVGGRICYVFVNDQYYRMLGYTEEQFQKELPNGINDIIEPEDLPRVQALAATAELTGISDPFEFRVRKRDGSVIWVNSHGTVCQISGIEAPVHIAVLDDITREKEAQQRIAAMGEQFRQMMDDTPGGFARMRVMPGGRLSTVYVNDTFCKMRGMTREEILRMDNDNSLVPVHPDDIASVTATLQEMVAADGTCRIQYRLLSGDGSYAPYTVFGRVSRDDTGAVFINAYFADMTEEEKQELAARKMVPILLSAIMDSSTDLVFAKDKDFNYLCCSPAFVRFTRQKSEADVIGKNDYDFWTKEEADHFRRDDVALMEGGKPLVSYIEEIPSDDGIQHYCRTSKYILRDSTGAAIGMYGIGQDITEERNTFAQLRALTSSIPGGLGSYAFSADGLRQLYYNEGFFRTLRYTREEYEKAIENDPLALLHPDDRANVEQCFRTLLNGTQQIRSEFRKRAKDGEYRWFTMHASVQDRRTGIVTVNVVQLDFTEKHFVEERLREAEERFRIAVNMSGLSIGRYDIRTRVYTHQDPVLLALGFQPAIENVPQAYIDAGIVAPESQATLRNLYERFAQGDSPAHAVVSLKQSDGDFRWCRVEGTVLLDDRGKPSQVIIATTDVTDQREKEAVYNRYQQSLIERKPDSYTLFRCNLNRNTSYDTVEGKLLSIVFDLSQAHTFNENTREYANRFVFPEDRAAYISLLNADTMLASYHRGVRKKSFEYRELLENGEQRWLRVTIELVEYPSSTEVEAYLMYENVDQEKRSELLIKELSETDPLTGVLNRITFAKQTDALIADMQHGTQCALLMLDIDGFKLLNDSFGHAAGDQALIDIADAIRANLRATDLLGRLGGDEFVICLPDIRSIADVERKAAQINAIVRKVYSLEVQISASIGITIAPDDGLSFDELYQKADAALYFVKTSGKDSYAFYNPAQHLGARAADRPAPDDAPVPVRKAQRRILIVEDNEMDAELLAAMFRKDYTVDIARDGQTALMRLRHFGTAISVVLLDLYMPGVDGFTVLARMQADTALKTVPVIVVSADDDRKTYLNAISEGATDYISKPVDPEILHIRVQAAISRSENERLRAQNSFLSMQNDEVAHYRAVLEKQETAMIAIDWQTGVFTYDPSVGKYIAGTFDSRKLWSILLSDRVADANEVKTMQDFVFDIARNAAKTDGSMVVRLKTHSGARHAFDMKVIKRVNTFGLADKIIITLKECREDAEA